MTTTFGRLLQWSPRVLGVLASVFIGVFALDAFDAGKPWLAALPDFLIHLIPAVILLGLVAAAFRWPWIGAAGFIGLAIAYAMTTARAHPDWTLTISGPLFVVGALFLLSWFRSAGARA